MIHLTEEELGAKFFNEIFDPQVFGVMKSAAMNYKYRPSDEEVLKKNPNLRFLPSEQEAKLGVK
jgi:hypothetical protein